MSGEDRVQVAMGHLRDFLRHTEECLEGHIERQEWDAILAHLNESCHILINTQDQFEKWLKVHKYPLGYPIWRAPKQGEEDDEAQAQ